MKLNNQQLIYLDSKEYLLDLENLSHALNHKYIKLIMRV